MSNNNWETVKPRKAFHNNKRFSQKPNERNNKPLKATKYGTSCLYCHEEGHWQWECGELGHKICKGKFQSEKIPQKVVNVYAQGPVFRKDKQQRRFPLPKEMRICQECGRKETAWVPVNEKHYIIISNEYSLPEDNDIEQKYGPLCLKCEDKFQRRISKAKGEYKPIECNQCGNKGSKDTMEQLEEGIEPKYYCDLNCLYARKILMEGKIDKERLDILLRRYTEGSNIKDHNMDM
jgi:hypothetical protein